MNQTQIQYLMNLPYTDPGNAERLHVMIGSDWKFVPQINRWVHWNGKRWQEETGFRHSQPAPDAGPDGTKTSR